jgi:hypothetical protein
MEAWLIQSLSLLPATHTVFFRGWSEYAAIANIAGVHRIIAAARQRRDALVQMAMCIRDDDDGHGTGTRGRFCVRIGGGRMRFFRSHFGRAFSRAVLESSVLIGSAPLRVDQAGYRGQAERCGRSPGFASVAGRSRR